MDLKSLVYKFVLQKGGFGMELMFVVMILIAMGAYMVGRDVGKK